MKDIISHNDIIQDFTRGEEMDEAKIYDILKDSKGLGKCSLNNIDNPFIKASKEIKKKL